MLNVTQSYMEEGKADNGFLVAGEKLKLLVQFIKYKTELNESTST